MGVVGVVGVVAGVVAVVAVVAVVPLIVICPSPKLLGFRERMEDHGRDLAMYTWRFTRVKAFLVGEYATSILLMNNYWYRISQEARVIPGTSVG